MMLLLVPVDRCIVAKSISLSWYYELISIFYSLRSWWIIWWCYRQISIFNICLIIIFIIFFILFFYSPLISYYLHLLELLLPNEYQNCNKLPCFIYSITIYPKLAKIPYICIFITLSELSIFNSYSTLHYISNWYFNRCMFLLCLLKSYNFIHFIKDKLLE